MRGRRVAIKESQPDNESVSLPIWQELMVGVEMLYLRISPVYWGWGVPHGDGSAVVVVPGFMGTDHYLAPFRDWLHRIGYKPWYSNIGFNAECPNLLLEYHLLKTIEQAYEATGKKVHLIGHSLGGMMARAAAVQARERIASVITLAAPFKGVRIHPSLFRTVEVVRRQILERHGDGVLPNCYTGKCTCDFLQGLIKKFPRGVRQTAIYTKTDGIVDWQVCVTGDPAVDFEVSATHLGMVFSPIVYDLVARRLAGE